MTNVVQKETFDIIRTAVNKTVDLIKPTYGPASNKVIIAKVTHGFVVDDGVQIARDLEFDDPNENAVLKVVRETAIRTNDRVGDGTTGALIMLQAIIEERAKQTGRSPREIEQELKKGFEEVKAKLTASAKPIRTKEELIKVARIAFDDMKIAEIIADTWFKIGVDGMITVDRSGTMETVADMSDGIKIDRGYISPYMVTNPSRMESVIEKPHILLTDYRLTEVNDILPAMNLLAEKQIFNLIVICDNMEQNALATAMVNKAQGKFNLIAINKPQGETDMDDIALLTNAKMFSMKKGDKLQEIKLEDFGRAERIIVRQKETVIVGPKGVKKNVEKAKSDLRQMITASATQGAKELFKKRLAFFTNKVAVIKVGAPTENEVIALKYKIEDAVNSTHAAFKNGVVSGAGLALEGITTSSDILNEALKAPFRQLKRNMGIEKHQTLKPGEAINVVTGKVGKFMEVGVVDPVDVLIAQVESAVSIAGLLITTSGLIVEPPKHIKEE
jgi:chaperonin GroEL